MLARRVPPQLRAGPCTQRMGPRPRLARRVPGRGLCPPVAPQSHNRPLPAANMGGAAGEEGEGRQPHTALVSSPLIVAAVVATVVVCLVTTLALSKEPLVCMVGDGGHHAHALVLAT